ncbi:MAG TPA: hypothetical protein VIT92_08125 [Burkholderiaceae bacterium]
MSVDAAACPRANEWTGAQEFSRIHGGADTAPFIRNLHARIEAVAWGDDSMPVTVNSGEAGNAWVCSPLATYRDYAVEEIRRNLPGAAAGPLSLLCRGFGYALQRAGIDRAVALNNWLLSTNLYPPLQQGLLRRQLDDALQRWPGHALWFRSLNDGMNADWLAALRQLDFVLIPSRQVYLYGDDPLALQTHGNFQRDLRMLHATALHRTDGSDFTDADYVQAAHLYEELYLQKYTPLNPQYTPLFIRSWHRAGLLQLRGFRDAHGTLIGVVGIFRQGGALTAPILGYSMALPQTAGLYRLLIAAVLEEAMQTRATVNLSAGAAHFKRLRGGKPAIEYSAVLATHMPASTQRAIAMLSALTIRFGIPIMRRFEL